MFRNPFPIIYVKDIAACVDFYCQVLGFEHIRQWPGGHEGPSYVFLKLGEIGLGLTLYEAAEEHVEKNILLNANKQFELCLYTDNVDLAAERLQLQGAYMLVPPSTKPWGQRVAYFEDPEGNVIHITGKAVPGSQQSPAND
jgi:lactoylglutathione lyase